MARPNVTIIRGSGGLGTVAPPEDGTSLLVVSFDHSAYGLSGTSLKGVQLSDFEGQGVTEALDLSNDELVWEHVKDFYAKAPAGTELHLLAIPADKTFANLFTPADAAYVLLSNYLLAQAGSIKLIGVALNPSYVEAAPTAGVSTDVQTAAPLAQTFINAQFALFRPISIILEGRSYTAANTAAAFDLRNLTAGGVSVTIARNKTRNAVLNTATHAMAGKYAALGETLGKVASIPVQRNIGRVKDGPLGWTDAELSGGQAISALTEADQNVLNTKGYIFPVKHSGLNGFFLNDDHTCVAVTSDYAYISRNRTIDKAARIARRVYLNELLDEVAVDPDSGQLAPIVIKTYEQRMQAAIEDEMVAANEVVSVSVVVDPNQDVLATSKVAVLIQVVPFGTARQIEATVQFFNPANA